MSSNWYLVILTNKQSESYRNYLRNLILFRFKQFSVSVQCRHAWMFDNNFTFRTLTLCDAAATDQFVMIPKLILHIRVSVIWICVYQTSAAGKRLPVDSDTTRLKFTRLPTFYQCGGSWMILAATCKCSIFWNPLGPAADVS